MLVFISILKLDYGPMARHERNAMETGDLFSGKNPYGSMEEEESSPNGAGCWTWSSPSWC